MKASAGFRNAIYKTNSPNLISEPGYLEFVQMYLNGVKV